MCQRNQSFWLETSEVTVGILEHGGGECFQSGNGGSLGKQDKAWQETGVIVHCKELGAIVMPFGSIMEDFLKVILSATARVLATEEGLGAEKTVRQIGMN